MAEEKSELIEIVSSGQIKALKELLELKNSSKLSIDLNAQDEEGNLAVVIAAKRNDVNMVELLIENGASITIADGFGKTVESWATRHKNEKMLQLVKSKAASNKSSVEIDAAISSPSQNGHNGINHTTIKLGGK